MITDFSRAWPDVRREVRAALVARQVPDSLVDEVLQETATRVLERQPTFDSSADLAKWCFVVAWRLVVDERRHAAREVTGTRVERPGTADVERSALASAELGEVRRAWPHLRPIDRAALVTGVALAEGSCPEPLGRREQVRDAVRRHRARSALLRIVGGTGALVAWIFRRGRTASVAVAAALPVVAGFAFVVPTDGPTESTTPSRRSVPVVSDAVTADEPPVMTRREATPSPSGGFQRPHVAPALPDAEITVGHPQDPDDRIGVGIIDTAPGDPLLCADDDPVLGDWCTPF